MDIFDMYRLIYQEDLPQDIAPMTGLLQRYSHLPSDQIESHLHSIRDKAWSSIRTPCIGRWRFLYGMPASDPRYKLAVQRLKSAFSRDCLLDLGCGMGQALRQLADDGVPISRLLGTDVHPSMIDIGFDLFLDRADEPISALSPLARVFSRRRLGLGSRFVVADLLDDCDSGLKLLSGHFSIIHASNFWHMFTWYQQIEIAVRLVTMLKPGTQNALIYGRHIGRKEADPVPDFHIGDNSHMNSSNNDDHRLNDPYEFSLSHDNSFDEHDHHDPSPRSPSISSISSISSTSSFDSEVAPFSDTSSLASSVSFSLPSETDDKRAFLHDQKSFQLLWDIVGERTLTRWRVEVDFQSKTTADLPGFGEDVYVVHYGVHQIR
ncbi:Methyltransferase ausD [Ceratocystis fimbriata CBS 114723]|uniref:Methyltransferase ausD n=1 Tax=Ceratocystis fimbriata CBS 114723 TaxID=1035309 RepID=A0A2C5WXU2_9PEZI|nr:Methyltransferase ausD [Ceratocystis fimbriata CBS 114723]